jgi:formylmethanofuran dehydrogenase subunit E
MNTYWYPDGNLRKRIGKQTKDTWDFGNYIELIDMESGKYVIKLKSEIELINSQSSYMIHEIFKMPILFTIATCSQCGEVGSVRPYGINGEMICLKCQIKPK